MLKVYFKYLTIVLFIALQLPYNCKVAFGIIEPKTKVSSNDTTSGYLNGKLVAGSNVSFTENNDGGNETLTIAAINNGDTAGEFLYIEGATANAYEQILGSVDPTADRNFLFPNDELAAGDVVVGLAAQTASYVGLADTEILVGDGSGSPANVSLSGDVTMANTGVVAIGADKVALTTDTTGNYAAGDAEAGNALTGDTATAFFSTGTVEDARLSTNVIIAGDVFSSDVTGTLEADGDTPLTIASNSVALTTDTTGNYAAGDAEAGAALTGDSATSFFSLGTIEHERGGLEADVSAYDGLVGITGGAAYNQTGTTTQIIIFDGAGAPTSAALSGDVTMTNAGVTTVGDDSHAHTTTTISGIDISDDTNLAGDTENVLTGDSLSIGAGITRDTEWDTVGEIETATSSNIILGTEIDTSSELAGILTDEVGTGFAVFNDAPNFTGSNVGLSSTTALKFGTDTGISRGVAGRIYVGNGTNGDYSGNVLAQTFYAGGGSTLYSSGTIYNAVSTGNFTIYNDGGGETWVSVYGNTHATLANIITLGTASSERIRILANGNVGIGDTTPDALLDVAGNIQTDGDLYLLGDDLFLTTNTTGFILVADGTSYNPVAISADATLASTGALTIAANAVALTTDTTGNYVATIADAGNSTVTVANSGSEGAAVTVDAIDVNCSNCIDGTDIALGSDAQGDVTYYDGTDWARLPAGTSGQFLKTQGVSANPVWDTPAGSGDVTDVFSCASGDCNSITIGTGELFDGGTATVDGAGEGIQFPRGTSCTAATEEGRVCWDTDNDTLYVGDSTTAISISGGAATKWNAIADADGDGSVDFVATEQDIVGQLDSAGKSMLTVTNQDADTAADTANVTLAANDGGDANVIYLQMIGDADGTPTTDYKFTQDGFTSLFPVNVPAEVYDETNWNSDTGAPQKDAVRDKLETMPQTAGDSLTLTGTDIDCDAASTTATGCIEIAIASEVDTGTDATRAVSPDALAGSNLGEKVAQMVVYDFTTDTAVGDGKFYFVVPSSLTGMNLVEVNAQVITAGTTGTTNVDLARCVTAASGNACSSTVADMLSTNMTIDTGENSTDTAATAAVIDTTNDDVSTGQIVRVDVDAVHTTAAKGLIITLIFRLP